MQLTSFLSQLGLLLTPWLVGAASPQTDLERAAWRRLDKLTVTASREGRARRLLESRGEAVGPGGAWTSLADEDRMELAFAEQVEVDVDNLVADVHTRWFAASEPRHLNKVLEAEIKRVLDLLFDAGNEPGRLAARVHLARFAGGTDVLERRVNEGIDERMHLLAELTGRLLVSTLNARRAGDAAGADVELTKALIPLIEAHLIIGVNTGDLRQKIAWTTLADLAAGVSAAGVGGYLVHAAHAVGGVALIGGAVVAGGVSTAAIGLGLKNATHASTAEQPPTLVPPFVRWESARRVAEDLRREFWRGVRQRLEAEPEWWRLEHPEGVAPDHVWFENLRRPEVISARVLELIGGHAEATRACERALRRG